MKLLGSKLAACLPIFAVVAMLGMAACMIKGKGGKLTPPPVLPDMSGAWDFTVQGGNGNLVALEAVLFEGSPGDLSGNITVNSFGGPGATTNSAMFEVDIFGSSLSTAADMAIDYLGNTCGPDNGNRTLTGSINASSQVALTYDLGGSSTVTISGTFNASATPPFSGSFTVSAPGCKSDGQTGTITGVLASSLTGSYSGTSASDNTDTITITLTATPGVPPGFNGISGSGTDSKNGNFTVGGGTLGNFLEGNFTGPGSPLSNANFFGYFDPQLGLKGSILLVSFQGGSATTCPSGVPIDNGSCLIAILAMQ
jgi:hypothetical protein